jgi:uncharacterized membrane protein
VPVYTAGRDPDSGWGGQAMTTNNDHFRTLAEQLLRSKAEDFSPHELRVIEKIAKRHAVARDVSETYEERLTFGQRLADDVAAVGGSWGFIVAFGVVIVAWVVLNAGIAAIKPFDPYPYIFLNLMLSMLAAIQAPVIMMSQNRQAVKDRLTTANDYEVNLKAELEILALHDKLDQVRNSDLAEILNRIERLLIAQDRPSSKA